MITLRVSDSLGARFRDARWALTTFPSGGPYGSPSRCRFDIVAALTGGPRMRLQSAHHIRRTVRPRSVPNTTARWRWRQSVVIAAPMRLVRKLVREGAYFGLDRYRPVYA
jgi:hypothetical protein